MEVVVDLEAITVVLADPEALDRFSVRVTPASASGASPADVHRLGDVLEAAGVGRPDESGDVFIRPDAVRFHAAGQVGAGWEEGFAGMCRYAESKGWVDPGDGWIRAHVEWPQGDA